MKLLRLLVTYAVDFVRANVTIARQLLSRDLQIDPEVIEMETEARTQVEMLALSNLITFTPGTLTLEIEPGKKLTVHALNDGPAARRAIRERLEKPLLAITR